MEKSKRVVTLLVWAMPVVVWAWVFSTDEVALVGRGMVGLVAYVTVGALAGARLCHRWEATVALVAAFVIGLSPVSNPDSLAYFIYLPEKIHTLMVGAGLWYVTGLATGAVARAFWRRAKWGRSEHR